MRRFFVLLSLLCPTVLSTWTWLSGSSNPNPSAVYASMGLESDSATPGGIFGHAGVIGTDGNFFIFGGIKGSSLKSDDVWSYNPQSSLWTWHYGSGSSPPAVVNYTMYLYGTIIDNIVPGGRFSPAVFFDIPLNSLYVFGGITDYTTYTFAINYFVRFDIDASTWFIVNRGYSHTYCNDPFRGGDKFEEQMKFLPPALFAPGYFTDHRTRTFFIFGGICAINSNSIVETNDATRYNDLWRFNVTSGFWAWLGGNQNVPNQNSLIASSYTDYTVPGARSGCSLVVDSVIGKAFIFGGYGFGQTTTGALNDLWDYDFRLKQFSLWKGSKDPANAVGVFGFKAEREPNSVPKGRWASFSAIDVTSGLIYVFGGQNYKQGSTTTKVYYFDGWSYDYKKTKYWSWISGGSDINYVGQFGDLGVSGFYNTPPGKCDGASGYDPSTGIFYIHGGSVSPNDQPVNDLFSFKDDVEQKLNYWSTLSEARMSHAPINTGGNGLSNRPVASQGNSLAVTFQSPYVIVSIIVALLMIISGVAAFVYTNRRDKEAGFKSIFKLNETRTTKRSTKNKPSTSTKMLNKLNKPSGTPAVVLDDNDSLVVVKPELPFYLQVDKPSFIIGQKIGSQNGIAVHSGSSISKALKEYGEHIHIKLFSEGMQFLKKKDQQLFWSEIELLNSFSEEASIAKMIAYCVEPVAIIFPYYPLGNLEQVFQSKSQQLNSANVLRIARNIARSLQLLHNKNLAHRNLKPRNVFLYDEINEFGVVTISAAVTGLGGILNCESEEVVNEAYLSTRIDSTSASFAAPELFLAVKGFPPTIKIQQAIKAADTFSFATILNKLLKAINDWN